MKSRVVGWFWAYEAAMVVACAPWCGAQVRVAGLRCEYRVNPLGVEAARPRLTWTLSSERRGERQTAYRVLVSSTPERLARGLGDLWDSGRVASSQSVLVPYSGRRLASAERCWWKVRAWGREGAASGWSSVGAWTMGILYPRDWRAAWIGASDATVGGPLLGYHAT